MGEQFIEVEVKYYINQLNKVKARLVEYGAALVQSRTHEYNLRFDTPAGDLVGQSKILRLRRDKACTLTYKEGNAVAAGASLRKEIEFTVSSFEAARAFLESLGYRVCWIYEKYRAVYRMDDVLVALDELPLGDFVEIEGPDGLKIQAASRKLGLNWEARIVESYADLFRNACLSLGLSTNALTFETFQGVVVSPGDLSVLPGDSV